MAAAISFPDLSSPAGLKHLDDYLLTRSYVSWYQASVDDLVVYCAIKEEPGAEFVNALRWYKHIRVLVGKCFPGPGEGVQIEGRVPAVQSRELPFESVPDTSEPAPATPSDSAVKAEDSDEDLDLFGEETEDEKKAAAEREEKIKTSAKKKETGKSSVLLEVKPWDDETDMQKLEEAVRSVSMTGLFWGASKLVPVGYGIKKLQIMMTIVDDLVSVDNLIEDYLIVEPRNEHIQSCDIAAFNKI